MPRAKTTTLTAEATTSGAAPTGESSTTAAKDVSTAGIDQYELPKALITRIAKSSIPPEVKLQKEMSLALLKSTTIFINYLAALSHDIATENSHKTISAQHVLEAVKELNWDDQAQFNKFLNSELKSFRRKLDDKKNGIVSASTVGEHEGRKRGFGRGRKTGKEVEIVDNEEGEEEDEGATQAGEEVKTVQENGANPVDPDEDPYQTGDEDEADEEDVDNLPEEDDDVPDDEEEEEDVDEERENGKGLEDDPMQEDE